MATPYVYSCRRPTSHDEGLGTPGRGLKSTDFKMNSRAKVHAAQFWTSFGRARKVAVPMAYRRQGNQGKNRQRQQRKLRHYDRSGDRRCLDPSHTISAIHKSRALSPVALAQGAAVTSAKGNMVAVAAAARRTLGPKGLPFQVMWGCYASTSDSTCSDFFSGGYHVPW